jgi:hypothetical protein
LVWFVILGMVILVALAVLIGILESRALNAAWNRIAIERRTLRNKQMLLQELRAALERSHRQSPANHERDISG